MEELIFFAVIIFFSILESIARSRRAKKGEGEDDGAPVPDSREREARLPDLELPTPEDRLPRPDGELPTYDQEPSYDDIAARRREARRRGEDTLERYRVPPGTDRPSRSEAPRRSSAEAMLPGDLLEQLEALARGRTQEGGEAQTFERPRPSPPLPAPIGRDEVGAGRGVTGPVGSTAPVGSRSPIGTTPVEHEVHRSHAGYGTDPSSRAPSEQDALGSPLVGPLDAEGVAVRRMLRRGNRASLRQAMVLKEVLGLPVSMRGDGGRDL